MNYLFNEHLNQEIPLLEGTNFSIKYNSQLQSLEGYSCCYSFDIECPRCDALDDCFNKYKTGSHYEYEATGDGLLQFQYVLKDTFAYPRVSLIVNGQKLYSGYLKAIETTYNTVKCSYQAVPANGVFKDFTFQPTLKDYFTNNIYHDGRWQLYKLFRIDAGAKIKKLHVNGYFPEETNFNGFDVEMTNSSYPLNWMESAYDVHPSQGQVYGSSYGLYWGMLSVDEMLKTMGIDVKYPDVHNEHKILIPMRIKYKRKLKVEMKLSKTELTGHSRYYSADQTTNIWWFNENINDWELLGPSIEALGTVIPVFQSTIRKMIGFKGLTFDHLEFDPEEDYVTVPQPGVSTYTNNSLYRSIEFGVNPGTEYDNGTPLVFRMTNILTNDDLPGVNQVRPFKIFVYFDLEYDYNPETLLNVDGYNQNFPFLPSDIEFFNMKTGDFLNQLSLNNSEYSWLREPGFLTKENATYIWKCYDKLSDFTAFDTTKISSIVRELKEDEPNSLRISIPTSFKTQYDIPLNGKGDMKEVEMSSASFGFNYYHTLDTSDKAGCPPIAYNPEEAKIVDHGIQCVFCRSRLIGNRIELFFDDDTNFDYTKMYADKSEVLHIKCVGYELTPYINFEGKFFAVISYTTKDFKVFDLEVAQINYQWK